MIESDIIPEGHNNMIQIVSVNMNVTISRKIKNIILLFLIIRKNIISETVSSSNMIFCKLIHLPSWVHIHNANLYVIRNILLCDYGISMDLFLICNILIIKIAKLFEWYK